MARTKQIIPGFNNGQKFRFIVRQPDVNNSIEFGMTLTIQEFFDKCATTLVRNVVTEGLATLSVDRNVAESMATLSSPTGLVKRVNTLDYRGLGVAVDVQVDLV